MEKSGEKALLHYIVDWEGDGGRVINFSPPEQLLEQMEKLFQAGTPDLPSLASFALTHSINTSHPLFLNQLYGGVHPVGLAASLIIEKMNTNCHTYEAAPIFVLAERIVLSEARKVFYGSSEGDGIFAPGGSFSNLYGFMIARHGKYPELKNTGLFGVPPLVIFTSQDSHYSVSKSANFMGLGLNNVVAVETNKEGQMIPSALQNAIDASRKEGKVPLVVNATAGTTVLGGFDDLLQISEICKSEGIWLHCDAAWGGSFIFSPSLRARYLSGIERCDSIAWNAHKMLGAPLQCSLFITKHPHTLAPSNSSHASYLFQPDKFYPIEFDRGGDKSFQCGRKSDGFKLWFMWTALGGGGFRALIEAAEEAAEYFTKRIKGREDFTLYLGTHQCTNVFFWYVPPPLQGKERDGGWWEQVGKERMVLEDGGIMIGYSPLPHKNVPNALRLVLPAYPLKTHAHMDDAIHKIVALGRDWGFKKLE